MSITDEHCNTWRIFVSYLREYGYVLFEDHELDFDIKLTGIVEEIPGPQMRVHIFNICTEALRNMKKHAKASKAGIRFLLDRSPGRIVIYDNGFGFDTNKAHPGHFGLVLMQKRVEGLDCTVDVDSVVNKGTEVTITFAT